MYQGWFSVGMYQYGEEIICSQHPFCLRLWLDLIGWFSGSYQFFKYFEYRPCSIPLYREGYRLPRFCLGKGYTVLLQPFVIFTCVCVFWVFLSFHLNSARLGSWIRIWSFVCYPLSDTFLLTILSPLDRSYNTCHFIHRCKFAAAVKIGILKVFCSHLHLNLYLLYLSVL